MLETLNVGLPSQTEPCRVCKQQVSRRTTKAPPQSPHCFEWPVSLIMYLHVMTRICILAATSYTWRRGRCITNQCDANGSGHSGLTSFTRLSLLNVLPLGKCIVHLLATLQIVEGNLDMTSLYLAL